MKIVFMGTPDFAAVSLERLYSDGHDVCAVFTQPDKPKKRGMKITSSPVKELALLHGTPVYQPTTLKDSSVTDTLRELNPDIIAVVAYGKLLPEDILSLPPCGCINIHGSLLPKYRGSAPVQWAVLNGEKETGVTSMHMAPAMDAGDIILKKKTEIGAEETAGELYDRLSVLGAALLSETIVAILSGNVPRIQQDESMATYAPPLTKAMSPINWNKTARDILCQIRGLNPWPVATTILNNIMFKVYKGTSTDRQTDLQPGVVAGTGPAGIEVACQGGTVIIEELQVSGGRRMQASEYLRGHPL